MEVVIIVVFKILVSKILNYFENVMLDLGISVNIVYLVYLKSLYFQFYFFCYFFGKRNLKIVFFCIFEISFEIYNCSNRRLILLDIFY